MKLTLISILAVTAVGSAQVWRTRECGGFKVNFNDVSAKIKPTQCSPVPSGSVLFDVAKDCFCSFHASPKCEDSEVWSGSNVSNILLVGDMLNYKCVPRAPN